MTTTKPNPADYPGRWVRARKGAYRSAAQWMGLCIPIADNAKYIRWYQLEQLRQRQEHARNNPDEFQ